MSKKFKEYESCETPGQCEELGMCQRALAIKIELSYEKKGKSSLGYQVENAKCRHPQAVEALKEARAYLSDKEVNP